jgi:hypothetical protein
MKQRPLQKSNCIAETLVSINQPILVLDAQSIVVANLAQRTGDGASNLKPVAPSHGPKVPRSQRYRLMRLPIEATVHRQVGAVDGPPLVVYMENCRGQLTDGSRQINAQPEQVTGIEIPPDVLSRGFSQLESCLRVVDQRFGAHFDCKPHALRFGIG